MSQLGSLGEALFHDYALAQGMKIIPLHSARADFLLDGRRVDVKTSRKLLEKTYKGRRIIIRHRVPETEYASVQFHEGGCQIHLEDHPLTNLSWGKVQDVFAKWLAGHFGKIHREKLQPSNKVCASLIGSIHEAFTKIGLQKPYILYRTVMFDNESPHNLLPSQRAEEKKLGWTVFLVCRSAPVTEKNLDYLIAFPDSVDPTLPRQEILRTSKHIENLQKADLRRIPTEFIYSGLRDLESHLSTSSKRHSKLHSELH